MGQHKSFSKDIDLLAEAYGAMLGGAHVVQGVGVAAQQAADHMTAEEGEEHDKTGHDSDRGLLAAVEKARLDVINVDDFDPADLVAGKAARSGNNSKADAA